MNSSNTVLPERAAFALRLGIGVVFGLVMAWLMSGYYKPLVDGPRYSLPPPWKAITYSTLMLTAFVWWAGTGTMRRFSLVAWGIAATGLVASLAWVQTRDGFTGVAFAFLAPVAWLILPVLFICHELVSSADLSKRVIAPYPTYFDQAWKHGVQLMLALLFTGLFWGILWLGAALLGVIGFHWLRDLLLKDWFSLPASGAAMACAVQLGDVQDKLLVNVRALVLSVLSWLLPVITAISLLFLASLCVSELEPLWKTKAAATTLLSASIAFVLLINAAYQQGDGERSVNIVMKWAARLAAFLLLAFSALAAYALWLRIGQYGLTSERVLAGAGVIIACLFGLGYAAAAVWPGRWLARLEQVNVVMAFVKVVIFLGLLTPLADPARLTVADQVARLQSGRTPADRFDWHALRFETDRYGTAALTDLVRSGRTAEIRAAAAHAAALNAEDRMESERWVANTPDDMSQLKVVYPAGAKLPATFTGSALNSEGLRSCVQSAPSCTAAIVDLDGNGVPKVLVLQDNRVTAFTYNNGRWRNLNAEIYTLSDDQANAFRAGRIGTQPHPGLDLTVGGVDVTDR